MTMRNLKLLFSVALITALSGIPPVVLAQEGALEIQNHQGIAFVTGGVGEEERDFLRTVDKDFNLKLMFAIKEGNYLSDVQVSIRDKKGQPVLEAVANGPFFYANLPPGTYTVAVNGPGQSFQQSVQVTGRKQARLNFYWRG
jgi:hypothetical protein